MTAPAPTQPYRYFISFSTAVGFGNTEIQMAKPIRSNADIEVVHQLLRKSGANEPVVLHFAQLPD